MGWCVIYGSPAIPAIPCGFHHAPENEVAREYSPTNQLHESSCIQTGAQEVVEGSDVRELVRIGQ